MDNSCQSLKESDTTEMTQHGSTDASLFSFCNRTSVLKGTMNRLKKLNAYAYVLRDGTEEWRTVIWFMRLMLDLFQKKLFNFMFTQIAL